MKKCLVVLSGGLDSTVALYHAVATYGKENVMSVQQLLGEKLLNDAKTFGADNKPLSPQQLQVKSLNDQSKKLKDQAKQVKARHSVQSAQAKLAKANQAIASDQSS